MTPRDCAGCSDLESTPTRFSGVTETLQSHFEQFQERLPPPFKRGQRVDDAKDVTRMMRGEEDDPGDLNDQIEPKSLPTPPS